jgi:hypothetical protein
MMQRAALKGLVIATAIIGRLAGGDARAEMENSLTDRGITHGHSMGYAVGLSSKCANIKIPREILQIKAGSDPAYWAKQEEEGRIAAETALQVASVLGKPDERRVCEILRTGIIRGWRTWRSLE